MKKSKLNNPDMRNFKEWNRPDANWHASSDITDEVKSIEHEVPRPPKKAGRNTRTQINDDFGCVLDRLYPRQDDDRGYQVKKNQKSRRCRQ